MKNIKIICASIILIALSGAGVIAMTTQRENVKIVLANGYEMTVQTSKTKVADILAESSIIVAKDEKVVPDVNEELTEGQTISITNKSAQEVQVAKISEEGIKASLEDLLDGYAPIVEKVWTEQVAIPFETVTKTDSEDESEDTRSKVVQQGQDGIKEEKYKAKFQNDVEIEDTRVVLSETVLEEPVEKIVQVQKVATSRASMTPRATAGSVAEYQAYAYQQCLARGWDEDDFDCLVSLWNRESGWNPSSYNSHSGAYGIPQALPASKMAAYGSDYLTNYETQIDWGLGYISSRYGTPSDAWESFQRKGWY